MLGIVSFKRAFRVLDLEYSEVEVFSVKLFKFGCVDLVFKLRYPKIFYLYRVCYSPFKSDRNGWKVVSVLKET